ncbi:MAG: hypothetical protein JWO13_835 [Acidobacteriales bacterium]|nr:hypothetical protein [Terriglobales bacterium]
MDKFQAAILNKKQQQLARYTSPAWTELNGSLPPTSGRPFIVTPAPFPAYPAPGAAAITVISYTVPRGMNAVIAFLAIVHVGGGFVDGTGNVIWRVLVNGAGVKGLEALQSQVGAYNNPNVVQLVLQENDVIVVTAEVPAAMAPMVGTTAARFHGFTVPVVRN